MAYLLSVSSSNRTHGDRKVSWRVFIAVPLASGVRRNVARWESAVRLQERGWRVVRQENLHLTLRFLGERSPERVDEIRAVLRPELRCISPLSVRVEGWGVFPNPSRPRVLWAGIRGEGEGLTALAERVDSGLAGMDEPPRDRPFRAHLTLGRARNHRTELPGRPSSSDPFFGDSAIDDVLLIRSHLSASGPRYEVVDHFHLGLADD